MSVLAVEAEYKGASGEFSSHISK